jgi:hypothetical protein
VFLDSLEKTPGDRLPHLRARGLPISQYPDGLHQDEYFEEIDRPSGRKRLAGNFLGVGLPTAPILVIFGTLAAALGHSP